MSTTARAFTGKTPAPRRAPMSPELIALRRAARAARRLAESTGTPFYVWRDGQVVDLNAKPRRNKRRRPRGARTSR